MNKNKKILAVASAGGHWTQILLLGEAFNHCDVHFLTTNINRSAIESDEKLTKVIDADFTKKLKLFFLALQIFYVVLRRRPNVIISTGAAPGFFAIIFGKLIGATTIWVDSMANSKTLSLSGKHASKACDLFLTQWPGLADNKKINYMGQLL